MKNNIGVSGITRIWKWFSVDFLGIFKEIALELLSAAHGVPGSRRYRIHRYHRNFFHQGQTRFISNISSWAGILGRSAMGA